ncbi:MAG: short-chain dehydrogenase [Sphingobacteriaceae bacterium]|jgi:NAD(P)-dependent dehydrogenase (short-subunit alcohol dehydrogenase family)|nr:short-chain dehydrogenase [Sphingobacteriaceae bacterium]
MGADVRNKVIVITGGSSGIGAAAARALCQRGAKVIITGRSEETERLAEEIGCSYYLVDYSSLSDVEKFAKSLIADYPQIDVLANNVGGIIGERRVTADGQEMTLQINHLSGFLLTWLLKERLEQSKGIVINTSSVANNFGKLRFDDLESEHSYKAMQVYGTAKLMNILHAMEISKRFNGVQAASFHPGVVSTGFAREGKGLIRWLYETPLKNLFLIPPEQGADTLLWLINGKSGSDWAPREYYYKRKPGRKNSQATSENAARLWEESCKLLSLPLS